MDRIGFVGLGIMGKPMAKNILKAGYSVTVYDINSAAVEELASCGAKAAENGKAVAESSDIIITMLPNSPHVKSAVLGENGILSGMAPGSVLIDMSSIAPLASKEICEEVEKKGCEMLDAPVSGGEPKAIDGSLSIMVGGKKEVFEAMKPLLQTMGATVVLCGNIGAGNTTKLANQIIVACNIAAVSEALELGAKAGVEPEAIYQAIRAGLAGSTVLDAKAPMMLDRNFKPGFRINLHIKDLNNVMETGESLNAPLPLSSKVLEMMHWLDDNGMGAEDHSSLVHYYEHLGGTEIRRS